MARRPKRSLVEELRRHQDIVAGTQATCAALAALYPDVAEFTVAARMLKDGCDLLDARATGAATPEPGTIA